jgi:DNA ligase 1
VCLSCRGQEITYLVRTLVRNLRVGANWRSVVPALGRAAAFLEVKAEGEASEKPAGFLGPVSKENGPSKAALAQAAASTVDAYHCCPNVSRLCDALLSVGVWRLEETCGVQVEVPLQPMLAKITNGFDDCVQQITGTRVLSEYKYDGQRAQIHVSEDGKV